MPQIGSDEKPVTFRSPIYKNTHGSKGANPRPGFYTQEYKDNWDRIFGGKNAKKKTTAKRTTKKKSTVNKAGNYTKPTMRKRLFEKIKAGSRGGKPGQWSARKAQLLAKEYKSKGGGYKSKKKRPKSRNW